MTDLIHMEQSATGREMRALSDLGTRLGSAWQSTRSAIEGNEGGIGSDLLGQAFRGGYLPDSTSVREAADLLPDAIMTDAALGNAAVADYGATDARAAGTIASTG